MSAFDVRADPTQSANTVQGMEKETNGSAPAWRWNAAFLPRGSRPSAPNEIK
jgi:hypothetical protein